MRTTILGMLLLTGAIAGVSGTQPPAKKETPAAVDRYGDSLPEGALGRLGTVRFRHGLGASLVAYTPDGSFLASAGRMAICVWHKDTGRLLKQASGDYYTNSLAFSPDGTKVVSGRSVIDVATMKELVKLKTQDEKDMGSCAAFSRTGDIIGSGGHRPGDFIIFWDAKTGQEIRRTKGHGEDGATTSIAFSPEDGKLLASANYDSTVRLWDSSTGKQIHRLEGHGKPVHCVAFARDGQTLVSGGEDGIVRIWDATTGKALNQIDPGHAMVRAVAFSRDGKLLACGGWGGEISLWDPESRNQLRRWDAAYRSINSLAFAPDGKTLASTDGQGEIRQWNTETGKEINPRAGHHGNVDLLRFAPDGKSLRSIASDKTIVEWNLSSMMASARRLAGTAGGIKADSWGAADLSSDGKMLAHTSFTVFPKREFNPIIRVCDTATAKPLHALAGHKDRVNDLKFSPDRKLLASSGPDGVRIWDVQAGRELHNLTKLGANALAFSPDGKTLAAVLNGGTIRQWDVAAGSEKRSWETGQLSINILVFSQDGKLLISSDFELARIWTPDSGQESARISDATHFCLAISPDGRVMATGTFDRDAYRIDSHIYLWDVRSGQKIRRIQHPHPITLSLAFAPDGRTLASGGSDSTILLWDMTGHADAKPAPLAAKQLDALWSDLAGDAAKADRAHWTLALSPEQSLPFLKERLRPVPPAEAARVAKLLVDLESATLGVRQKAERDLADLGEAAQAALRARLEANPPLEVRRRVEQILVKREPDALRQLRTIDVLREIATPQAREVLETLAKATPHPRVAQAATAALARP